MFTYFLIPIVLLLLSLLNVTLRKFNRIKLDGKHVIISGGSKGIGKELALLCFQRGAKVTILARNIDALQEAKEYLIKHVSQRNADDIRCFSIDVTESYEKVLETFKKAEHELGPIAGLFNIVGRAICYRFMETPIEDFHNMMMVNYYSAINCTRAAISLMIERKSGFIELTSSLAGLFGVYGLGAYSASKFALVGLAETLAMELTPHNISITIAFPPDTDTPGYEIENRNKPEETKLVCESAGVWAPSRVAEAILNDTIERKFASTVGIDGHTLKILSGGMMRPNGFLFTLMEVILMSPLRLVSVHILHSLDKTIMRCHKSNHPKSD